MLNKKQCVKLFVKLLFNDQAWLIIQANDCHSVAASDGC